MNMQGWKSLSWDIDDSSPVFPGDRPLHIAKEKTLDRDGYNLSNVSLNMHIGTHIDYPSHVLANKDDFRFDGYIGYANVLYIQPKNGLIKTDDIRMAYQYIDQKEAVLIIDTGHRRYVDTQSYFKCPVFDRQIHDFLKAHQIKILGADMPSFEYKHEKTLDMHKDLLADDILLLENLRHLDHLTSRIELMILPLFTHGLEASLVHVKGKSL